MVSSLVADILVLPLVADTLVLPLVAFIKGNLVVHSQAALVHPLVDPLELHILVAWVVHMALVDRIDLVNHKEVVEDDVLQQSFLLQ